MTKAQEDEMFKNWLEEFRKTGFFPILIDGARGGRFLSLPGENQ